MTLTRQPSKKLKKWTANVVLAIFFILGISLLFLFTYLHKSQDVQEYINKINSSNPTAGLRLVIFYGIAKLLSILLGILIIVGVAYNVINNIRNKRKDP